MTNRNDVLAALAAEIRASLGNGTTASTRRRWAIEIEALAKQPAEGVQGENDIGCGDHDHDRFIPGCAKCAVTLPEKRTTPPAASVDVEPVIQLMNHLEDVLPDEVLTLIATDKWNAVTNLCMAQRNAAGGAKGEWRCACGDVNAANETCGLCHQSAPQPDGDE